MAVRMGAMELYEQPERGGRAMRCGTALRDAQMPWYPCVAPAGYNMVFSESLWRTGNVTVLKAVDAAGSEFSVMSDDAELAVYGLDFSCLNNKQAVKIVYAGRVIDAVMTVGVDSEE